MTTPRLAYQDLDLPESVEEPEAPRRSGWLLYSVLAIVLLTGIVLVRPWSLAGESGGLGTGSGASVDPGGLMSHKAERVDLQITVLEWGTLESAASINVLSEVEGRVAIIRLLPEGTRVEAGEVVVELDSSLLRRQLTEQRIVVAKAEAAHSQAQQTCSSAASQGESQIATAELNLEFAELDKQKYEKGEYPVQLRSLQTEIALAQEEHERAQTRLQFSEDLAKDGYINNGELEADRFRVTQAAYKVEIARERERLLKEYTYPRTMRDLEARVVEAERALARARSLAEANSKQAEANLKAQEATLELEQAKLAKLEDQIDKCSMRAPKAGVVVYPIPGDDDLVELFIKEGTVVRERQHVFSIPDTDVLQVNTQIHEAMVSRIKPGMQARIWIDVYPDMELRGEVLQVAPLPIPDDWRRKTVKFYDTKVSILTQVEGLRPGMSSKVEILVDQVPNVLAVPVQSVVQRGSNGVCYVLGSEPELRKVRLGKSNGKYVAVLEGLTAGERVVLSPDVLGIPAGVLDETDAFEWEPAVLAGDGQVATEAALVEEEVAYEALLTGTPGIRVDAEYKIKTLGSIVNYKFEIEVRGGVPGTSWDVTVDGFHVGEITLDAAGNCEAEWNTKDGTFPDGFPIETGNGSEIVVGPEFRGFLSPAL